MGILNIDSRFGLSPVGHFFGLDWNAGVRRCYVASTYATALFVGDPVELTEETDDQDTTGEYMSVKVPTVGDTHPLCGAIVACEPNRDNLSRTYIPASTGGYVLVAMDPYTIFQIRDDGVTAPTKLWPGQNANLIATHSGSTSTGMSGYELDSGSAVPAANASFQLLILNKSRIEGNDLAARAIWDVLINLHQFKSTGDGDGMLGVTAT